MAHFKEQMSLNKEKVISEWCFSPLLNCMILKSHYFCEFLQKLCLCHFQRPATFKVVFHIIISYYLSVVKSRWFIEKNKTSLLFEQRL